MNTRYLIIGAALVLVYFWWKRQKAGTITNAGEWNDYQPSNFRVLNGGKAAASGMSIVSVDDK